MFDIDGGRRIELEKGGFRTKDGKFCMEIEGGRM